MNANEYVTVSPSIPNRLLTPVMRKLLEAYAFHSEPDGHEQSYFCVPEWINSCPRFEITRAELEADTSAIAASVLEQYNDRLERAAPDETVELDLGDELYLDVLQEAIKRSDGTLKEVVLEGAYTASKMRPGEFGGFVVRITEDNVQHKSTADMLEDMRRAHPVDAGRQRPHAG